MGRSCLVEVHSSALKHGISAESSIFVASNSLFVSLLDDDNPSRELRLGFDEAGRLLELVALIFDSGNELIIHAMKARSQYYELIK